MLCRALNYFAEAAGETPAEFRVYVQAIIDGRVAALAREAAHIQAYALGADVSFAVSLHRESGRLVDGGIKFGGGASATACCDESGPE
jgi:hypothetical protein